jgi:membrane fusion protein, multidrug efflux system
MGFAILMSGLAGCSRAEPEVVEEGDVVILGASDVATAEEVTVNSGVALTGSLNPYQRVEVRAQVPGVVSALAAERGQSVRAGAVLARIQAQGITSQAAGARSAVAAAQAGLALAQRQMESATTLFQAGAMSEIDYRRAQTQFEAAQAQLAAAEAQATGAGELAQRTVVSAPITGEISSRSVSQGEAVNPGQTLFEVVNSSTLELEGQVPVDQAGAVREGQAVVFTIDAYPGKEFRGTVARVSPVADLGTRQVGVVLRLPNEDRALIGGLYATGRVLTESATQAVVVPAAAVRGTADSSFVLTIENGVVTRRPVALGTRDVARGVVAINSGIQAGERVIVAPGAVPEGARVESPDATQNVSAG